MSELTVRDIQASAWANKLGKSFNTTDVALEFGLLYGEVAEAFTAWRSQQPAALADELADIAIYLVGLAEMTGVDLQTAIAAKLAVNAGRIYRFNPVAGILVKAETPVDGIDCARCDAGCASNNYNGYADPGAFGYCGCSCHRSAKSGGGTR
ncbi:MazG-like family protein [Actinoplanes aureus]|uniref:NTP pyrophosphohydrolase MazG putative catalytic core domain-containing protein n=1 Tax=Actinoplanes aureus TaxID=2792083 RepID=A0A931G4L1_9ACTN|nr:MazG-like family protein [Actinoplanes aureus]MBG0568081.1 hypothetical protein [Actinoplanes aureus]